MRAPPDRSFPAQDAVHHAARGTAARRCGRGRARARALAPALATALATLLVGALALTPSPAAQDQGAAPPDEALPPAPGAAPDAPVAPRADGSDGADGAEPPSELRVARPATVNGESITSEDIAQAARLLREERPELPLEALLKTARRRIAEQILLAGDAERRGVTLSEREVDDYWERRRGTKPDYEALAAESGTTVERQKRLMRRTALSELYLLHRIGLRMDYARQIPPEPLLVRLVTITPSQLRDAFSTNKDLLGVPAHVALDVYRVANLAAGETLCAALAEGRTPVGVEALERVVPEPEIDQNFPPQTAAFLHEAPPGACRVDAGEQGGVVMVIRSHEPERPARFEEVQERLRLMLQRELIEEARQHLVAALADEASCWPRDLFGS